ncbi:MULTISPECIES: HAD-IIIA family hydrolase [Exiguobacterium]|uniref:HAD-IIIA family hydrolase n=1 Tax=Exiguobacterium TaxID=33986 RepID=UPI0004945237|nr:MULTISPECIES: HAD-IIIA family hydrolase [Exiguobacterium]HCD58424.1 HAD-IIIA family hydrolase [Exiguobacterium sp.]
MNFIQVIFLDRDGTIGGDATVHYPGTFTLFPYVPSLIERLRNQGVLLIAFTNQPGISKGFAREKDFRTELKNFGFDDVLICPHAAEDRCTCRKPSPNLLWQAQTKHNLRLEQCVVIGDRWSDMVAAAHAGCIKILVRTGAGECSIRDYADRVEQANVDYIADDLTDAIAWLDTQN